MRRNYSEKEKRYVVNRYLDGSNVTSIYKDTGIARGTIYSWIKSYQKEYYDHKNINLRDVHFLKQAYERQKKIIEILKRSPCSTTAPLAERYAVIVGLSNEYNESLLCEALSVAKGSYYNFKLRGKRGKTVFDIRRAQMAPIIEQVYHENNQIFGPAKIYAILKDRGYAISERTVATIMRKNGWFSIRQGSKKLYQQQERQRHNILNQNFKVSHPNEAWVSDVTYFRCNGIMYYICVILDLFSRKVIGYKISKNNSTQLTKGTFKIAYKSRQPSNLLFHSDQGANYTSKTFINYLREQNVKQSFSNAGIPYDNSVMESFFKSMKTEWLYRTKFRSEREFLESVDHYIKFYNKERPHSVLANRTPDTYEANYYKKIEGQSNN